MGATDFQTRSRGKNINDAYRRAVERAIDQNGSDGYNGTISTTRGVKDVTSMFISSKLESQNFINKHIESCEKWKEAWGICINPPVTNNLKVKSKVIHTPSKGTRKWVLKYEVSQNGDTLGSKDTKGEAVTLARTYTEKNGLNTTIKMKKVLESGDNTVATIEYKKSTKEQEGEYVFFGMAVC